MKTAASASRSPARWRAPAKPAWLGLGLALFMAVAATDLLAQATVQTLGGGHADRYGQPNGFVDGDTLEAAMFDGPVGPAVGPDGNLWLADRNNGAIRKLLLITKQTRTVLTNLNQPVGIVFDRADTFYVLTAGDGSIKRYDTNLNLLATITTVLVSPNAFAMDSGTNFYVAQGNGTVVRVHPTNGVPITIATGLSNPGGIAVTIDGFLVVSDSGNHAIKFVNPALAPTLGTIITGGNGAGLKNGDASIAQFNSPQGIAQAPNGQFLVADRLNHVVRLVATNGYTSTFYAVPQANWVSEITTVGGFNGGTIWPGWADGPYDPADPSKLYPAARDPMSVLVTSSGAIYTTEWGYHIVREVTGVDLVAGGGGGGPVTPPVTVQKPTISPNTGYFPNGQMIAVGSPNPDVFYTMDGTDPTTNSLRVPMTGNAGKIWWQNAQSDLSLLRVRAYVGTNRSEVVSGLPVTASTIGVTPGVNTNYFASPGSTIFVPVVVNLIPGAQIKSLFYRVDVRAAAGVPSVSDQFRLVPVSTNDFIRVVGLQNSSMTAFSYGDPGGTLGGSRGLLISAVGTNLGGTLTSFGVLNMLAIPIPATAPTGAIYTIGVINPSATSDGLQTSVPILASGVASVTVGTSGTGIGVGTNPNGGVGAVTLPAGAVGYLVGDSAPGGWFNAGEFGDGNLDNADVNNAFYASLNLRVPPNFSDAFDAMDAFPLDTIGGWGGDGEIRFLDWQVILQRASRIDPNNFVRVRQAGGAETVIGPFVLTGAPDGEGTHTTALPGSVWYKQAEIRAGIVANAEPGQTVRVPVYVKLLSGFSLSGMEFSATVRARDPLATPITGVTFDASAMAPSHVSDGDASIPFDTLYRVWQQFPTVVRGETLLGHVRFVVPANATAGQCYVVRFLASSGGDTSTIPFQEPKFESLPGFVWVRAAAPAEPARISDEWRRNFFGAVDAPAAGAEADPDGDGVPNWKEFLAGTHPARGDSALRLQAGAGSGRNVVLNWLTAPAKSYLLEYTDNLRSGVWTSAGTYTGDGNFREINVNSNPGQPRFYRVRLAP